MQDEHNPAISMLPYAHMKLLEWVLGKETPEAAMIDQINRQFANIVTREKQRAKRLKTQGEPVAHTEERTETLMKLILEELMKIRRITRRGKPKGGNGNPPAASQTPQPDAAEELMKKIRSELADKTKSPKPKEGAK